MGRSSARPRCFSLDDSTLARVPDGARSDLVLDLSGTQGGFVRLTIMHAGAQLLLIDELELDDPPSDVPMCFAEGSGTCEPSTGECSFVKSPDGTACNDGDCLHHHHRSVHRWRLLRKAARPVLRRSISATTSAPATLRLGSARRPPSTTARSATMAIRAPATNPNSDPTLNASATADACQSGVCKAGSATVCRAANAGDPAEQCYAGLACDSAQGGACVFVNRR